jgi:hypothetical protein
VLATLYSALEETNALPVYYQTINQQRESANGRLALSEMQRLKNRFEALLRSVDASSRLAHKALEELAPGVIIECPEQGP